MTQLEEKGRFLLIHNDEYVCRFKTMLEAKTYAQKNCRGSHDFYIVVDLEIDAIVKTWVY